MKSTERIQIRTNKETKERATKIFKQLGLDMSAAINIYLKQVIMLNKIPFSIKLNTKKIENQVISNNDVKNLSEATKNLNNKTSKSTDSKRYDLFS